jgi:hypothetical protein
VLSSSYSLIRYIPAAQHKVSKLSKLTFQDQTVALLETKGRSDVVNESVLGLLSDLERALANEVAFYNGDISDLELTLRGVEVLSVDWTVALCKLHTTKYFLLFIFLVRYENTKTI